ncbi:MAG: transposase, partial [Bacteroidota bacterium]
RDLGYYNFKAYQEVIDSKGLYISKLKSQVKIFELQEDEYVPLSYQQLIERLEGQDEKYFDQEVYLGTEKKLAVRMTASLADEESIARRIKKPRKRHAKVSEASLLATKLNIFITNIDTEVSAEQLYQLYRLRWQIELVFKAWKSVLKLSNFGQMKAERLKCYIYAKLLWIMVSWDIYQHGTRHCWKERQRSLSINKVYQQVKLQADLLRKLMGRAYRSIKRWLKNLLYLCVRYGKKDQKKGQVKTEEIMMQVVDNQQ